MKIKYNENKNTVSIKNMTSMQFAVLNKLMSHVRLGQGLYDGGASDAVFEFLEAIESMPEALNLPDISLASTTSEKVEGVCIILEEPTLEVYVN